MSITLDAIADQHIIAIADYGVFLNTQKITEKFQEKPLNEQTGKVWTHYYKPVVKDAIKHNAFHFKAINEAREIGETTFVQCGFMLLDGSLDFIPSTISTPWDFLPLKLMLDELGGRVAKTSDGHDLSGERLLQKNEACLVVRFAPQWDTIRSTIFSGMSEHEITTHMN